MCDSNIHTECASDHDIPSRMFLRKTFEWIGNKYVFLLLLIVVFMDDHSLGRCSARAKHIDLFTSWLGISPIKVV